MNPNNLKIVITINQRKESFENIGGSGATHPLQTIFSRFMLNSHSFGLPLPKKGWHPSYGKS